MSPRPEAPLLHFEDAEAFEAWVAAQPEDSPAVWLRIARKGAGAASVTYGEALIAAAAAAAEFEALDGANRYAILYRVGDAKRAETRARRIARYVAMLARGERLH